MKPVLVELPAFHVVGLSGRFTPETTKDIPQLWAKFGPRMMHVPGLRKPGTSYGLCVADPQGEKGPPALEYTAAVEVASLTHVPEGMVGMTVPAGTYAVFTHTGPIDGIGKTWDSIYSSWLPSSGLQKRSAPEFEKYDERWDVRTRSGPVDIHIPVVGKR